MSATERMLSYIGRTWCRSGSPERLERLNPATGEVLGKVPPSGGFEVDEASNAPASAYVDCGSSPR